MGARTGLLTALASALVVAACGVPERDTPLQRGTWTPPQRTLALRARASTAPAIVLRDGFIVAEGDGAWVSAEAGGYGLRVDDERNDLAALTAAAERALGPLPGVLVVVTRFPDLGSGGAGYHVPTFHDTPGSGRLPLDQRARFGTRTLRGVAVVKQVLEQAPTRRVALLIHEVAHLELAHLDVAPLVVGTTSVSTILGRQQAHWHAALETEGSVLEGYGYARLGPGPDGRERFEVRAANVGLSSLDLYGLGLLDPDEVPDTFFIADLRNDRGSLVPPAAQLALGDRLSGWPVPISIAAIQARVGPRARATESTICAPMLILTTPGESVDAPEVLAQRPALRALADEAEATYATWTRGRGRLALRLEACPTRVPSTDAGPAVDAETVDASTAGDAGTAVDAGGARTAHGCTCTRARREAYAAALAFAGLAGARTLTRRRALRSRRPC